MLMIPFNKSLPTFLLFLVILLLPVGGVGNLPAEAKGEKDCSKELRAFTHVIIDSPIFKAALREESKL